MNGDGAAADSTGNLYCITGDGLFDADTGGTDYGDSFLKLSPAGSALDYFTPSVQTTLDADNLDLGSGGVLLLPDQSGAHPHEMVSAGKNGTIYLVDRDNMGHYHSNTDQIVQSIVNIFTESTGEEGGNFSSPVYFNGRVYFAPVEGNVQAFQLSSGLLSTTPTSRTSATYDGRGGTMAISANGNTNGILWASADKRLNSSRHAARVRRDEPGQRVVQQRPGRLARHARYMAEVHRSGRRKRQSLRRLGRPTHRLRATALATSLPSRTALCGHTGFREPPGTKPIPDLRHPERVARDRHSSSRSISPAATKRRSTDRLASSSRASSAWWRPSSCRRSLDRRGRRSVPHPAPASPPCHSCSCRPQADP